MIIFFSRAIEENFFYDGFFDIKNRGEIKHPGIQSAI